jgi:hypothetical protein
MDFVSLVSNRDQRLDQKVLRNLLSWSEMMVCSYPKVDPHSFKEELGSIYRCDIIFTGCEDGHLRKPINNHKHVVISLLGGWQARHLIH